MLYKRQIKQENHAIAQVTARCAQYMSALKKQPTIAQESPPYNLITIRRRNYFRSIATKVTTVPKRYRRSDRRTIYCGITAQ